MMDGLRGFVMVAVVASMAGCGHSAAAIARDEWCARVESFRESDRWQCTWPPSRYAPGDFGPSENPSRYNVVGAVFDPGDATARSKASVRKIGTLDIAYQKTVTVEAHGGLDLRSLSSWLPDATISSDRTSQVTVSFRLEDAEWRLYANLAPEIARHLGAKASDDKQQAALERGRDAICQPGTTLVEGVLVGRIAATIKSNDHSSTEGGLGWKKLGTDVKTTKTEGSGITVNGVEPVAVLHLGNPSTEVLKSFGVCAGARSAPLPECGENGEVCCPDDRCSHDLSCLDDRCLPASHMDRGIELFALSKYDEAIKEFEAGFVETPASEYLYNIAKAHLAAGRSAEAATYLRRYLEAEPTSPQRAAIEAQIDLLERAATPAAAPAKPAPHKPIPSSMGDDLAVPNLKPKQP